MRDNQTFNKITIQITFSIIDYYILFGIFVDVYLHVFIYYLI